MIDAATGGGPVQATTTLIYKIYREGFTGLDLVVRRAVGGADAAGHRLTILQFRFVERKVQYQ